jgi:hypothetical protein
MYWAVYESKNCFTPFYLQVNVFLEVQGFLTFLLVREPPKDVPPEGTRDDQPHRLPKLHTLSSDRPKSSNRKTGTRVVSEIRLYPKYVWSEYKPNVYGTDSMYIGALYTKGSGFPDEVH